MAEVEKVVEQIPVTTYTEQKTIILKLSPEEANFISALLWYIGGSPKTTIRSYADDIDNALVENGIQRKFQDLPLGNQGFVFDDNTYLRYR